MAIDRGSVALWRQLRDADLLPEYPAVLEIGEANWYGDVPLEDVGLDYLPPQANAFVIAKVFYGEWLKPSFMTSIDKGGQDARNALDLNEPVTLPRLFDIVINTGTLEHVFDQRQVFETIHDYTRVGGLMVHTFPVAGCTDHGFYTYSPCLIRDLGKANHYEFLCAVESRIDEDRMVHLAWQKTRPGPFVVPQQSVSRAMPGGEFTTLKGKEPCQV